MKKIFLFILVFCMATAMGQVGVHTDFPDNSSAMDIVATNRGLLIPRVTLTSSLSNPSPVTSPAVGLLVFNSGANQAVGFYYWNGSTWVALSGGSGGSGNDWTLTGNAGTIPGTNFLGTTDNNNFLVYTNNTERMRFESDGQVIVGGTVPQAATHVFTVYGNTTQNFAIAAFSPTVGFYNFGGRYGVFSQIDSACTPNPGFAVWAKNTDVSGYGIYSVGSNVSAVPLITSHTAGITSYGFDGLHAWGRNATTGHGLCAIGSGQNSSFALSNISAGVSSIGNYGIISRGTATTGRGIVAIGSGLSTPNTSLESEGGAFTGFHGIFGSGNGYQTTPTLIAGIGVIGIGYNYSSYSALASGLSSGGSFTGDYGVYGKGLNATSGVGILGVGSAGAGYYTLTNGSGGAFTGYHGSLSVGSNVAAGIGVVGAGNNSSYNLLPAGAGGIFTAINTGSAGFATANTGTGVVGAGNNQAVVVLAAGSGGAFSGTVCGVHGFAYNSSDDRYGGYFATNGSLYAYVGGRYSNTNRKIVGTGNVSTIVKSRSGERITLTCPEAPESLFQDYGVGQLVNGFAHITLDPDLAININVSDKHPLKVFITPEGDCNGVYVTNKSVEGFDVIELQGGRSNVPFSWQIVATRANEEYFLKDGTIEVSDYSQRFQPAPGPLESLEVPTINSGVADPENMPVHGTFVKDQTINIKELNIKEDTIIQQDVEDNE